HPNEALHIRVDSTYVFNGVSTLVWHWRDNGWLTKSSHKPVTNQDLWERLLTALEAREIETTWERIPGHNGNVWNELCDKLAVAESRQPRAQ
ncbi:MAG TPA: RNase H family protein, partial [Galbitalea sp.]